MHYQIEASIVGGSVSCPNCGRPVQVRRYLEVTSAECPCGAKIEIKERRFVQIRKVIASTPAEVEEKERERREMEHQQELRSARISERLQVWHRRKRRRLAFWGSLAVLFFAVLCGLIWVFAPGNPTLWTRIGLTMIAGIIPASAFAYLDRGCHERLLHFLTLLGLVIGGLAVWSPSLRPAFVNALSVWSKLGLTIGVFALVAMITRSAAIQLRKLADSDFKKWEEFRDAK